MLSRSYYFGAVIAAVGGAFLFNYILSQYLSLSLSKLKRKEMTRDKRMLNLRFTLRNSTTCINAVTKLTNDYANISLSERMNLLIARYRVSIALKKLLIINRISRSTRRAIFMAIIEIFK